MRAEAPHDAIMSNGRTPVAAHGHARALTAVAPNGLIDRTTARHHTGAHRKVLSSDLARRESGHERRVDFGSTRHNEKPARIFVESMH